MAHQAGPPTWISDSGPALTNDERKQFDKAIEEAKRFWLAHADVLEPMLARGRALIASGNIGDIESFFKVLIGMIQGMADALAGPPAPDPSNN